MESNTMSDLAILGGTPIRPKPIEMSIPLSEQARARVMNLLDTGLLSEYYNGPAARQFEEAFARYHGPDHRAIAVNSGTSALHLAVSAAGIGPGDEVIVPALCFVAAAIAVAQNGAIPIICDAEPESLTLDVRQAERLIGPRTKAILTVHFWGYPSDTAALRELCDSRGIVLIEDCAQALGATAHGATVGTLADYATFAFSQRKHLACGEGGVVMCRSEERYERLRQLSNYGKGPGWDDYRSLGFSYRMPEFSAIVALDGLGRVDDAIEERRQAGHYYAALFRGTGLTPVAEPAWGRSVYFKCPLLLPAESLSVRRSIVDAVSAENVSCKVPHRPLYTIPWLSAYLQERGAFRGADACPVAAANHARLIEIESGPHFPLAEAQLSGTAVLRVWRHFAASAIA
jgi:perosamine synthetase